MGLFERLRPSGKAAEPGQKQPRGASGRAHTEGFLDFDEWNSELRGTTGLRIFDEMYRTDGDVRQVISLVSNPIVGGTWEFFPFEGDKASDEDKRIIKACQWAFFDHMCPNLHSHLAQALPVLCRAGFVPFEAIWESADHEGEQLLVPKTLQLRLPRTIGRWITDEQGELVALVQDLPVPNREGKTEVTMAMANLVYYRVGAEGDNWEGQSFLRPAYKHWRMKDAIERIDAIAQEREAVGIPIAYPPMGASPQQLDAMEEVLANIRANEQGYIIAPGPHAQDVQDGNLGWRIEIMGYERHGAGRDPMPSLKYHTNKIMAAFISEFMELGHNNVGARATAQVQALPFMQAVEALVSLIEETLNTQLIAPFVRLNFPDAQHPPKLRMSLVDNTSLTQLADFLSKLVMVGAIIPDQKLENWMRERAELPPPDPDAVQAREDAAKDAEARKEVIIGVDPFGPGAGGGGTTGGSRNGRTGKGGVGSKAAPGLPHGTKPTPARDKPTQTTLDDLATPRMRWREPDRYEQHVDLDGIETYLDEMPESWQSALRDHIYRIARGLQGRSQQGKRQSPYMTELLRNHLDSAYAYGRQTVEDEIVRQLGYDATTVHLEARGSNTEITARVALAAEDIEYAMNRAYKATMLAVGDDARAQAMAEREGMRAVKHAAMSHGGAAFNIGRTHRILEEADNDDTPDVGVKYTSILDRNRCEACADADDGQVRELDDPVRQANRPPNPHCHSNLGGHNACRCFEVLYFMGEPVG